MTGSLYLLILAAAVFIGWRISLRIHPYTACRRCKGNPRQYGSVFTGSFSLCPVCQGTGRQLRWGAKPPAR